MKRIKSYLSNAVKNLSVPFPDPYGWPPDCGGMFYQPERPMMVSNEQHSMHNSPNIHDSEYEVIDSE